MEHQDMNHAVQELERCMKQQLKMAKLQCILSAGAAVCCGLVLIAAISLVPHFLSLVETTETLAARANTVLADLETVTSDLAEADLEELMQIVRPCGLFRTKADNLKEMSRIIVSRFAGEVPSGMEELLSLPGVGRKIANLIRGDLFGLGGVVADTHCIRICGRLGFYPESEKDAVKVEKALDPIVPKEEQTDLCHRLVWFGRDICNARSPRCGECPLSDVCSAAKKLKTRP